MNRFSYLYKNNLCLGCGLCESLGKQKGYRMKLDNSGFYKLSVPKDRDFEIEKKISLCCPSINIVGSGSKALWGPCLSIYRANSKNEEIRKKASSGGFVTTLCCYMLENGLVDAVLHAGVKNGTEYENTYKVSRSTSDVINNASSRYAPVPLFQNLKQLLDESNERYAIVGKSCDILCLKNFIQKFPEYKERFIYFIAIFCAGMPSYNGTKKIIDSLGSDKCVKSVKYRGDGWPGDFVVSYQDGSNDKLTYQQSWMDYLGRALHYRCKICPDSIGTLSDISVCDAWDVDNNGKAIFEDRPGKSCILIRTNKGKELLDGLIESEKIESETYSLDLLSNVQSNHVRKRLSSGFKILGLKMFCCKNIFVVRDMNSLSLMCRYNPIRGIKDMIGALKRFNKWR